MLEKTVNISGTEVRFRSSAAIPRLYRIKFKRDIFKDLAKLEASYKGKTTGDGEIPIEDLEIFENVAYVMAYHADHSIPGNIDDWLDQFEMFSIYEVLPEILELWGTNLITDVNAKKNLPSDHRPRAGHVDRKRKRRCYLLQDRNAGGFRQILRKGGASYGEPHQGHHCRDRRRYHWS